MDEKPKLIVFDCDYTLWPLAVDDYDYKYPYKKNCSDQVVSADERLMNPFPEVDSVFEKLASEGIQMAAASRTTFPDGGNLLIKLFGWEKYLTLKEIYPGQKTAHFSKFKEATGLPYQDMLFFDDEQRNINDIGAIGVTAILVSPKIGMNMNILEMGLKKFAENRKMC